MREGFDGTGGRTTPAACSAAESAWGEIPLYPPLIKGGRGDLVSRRGRPEAAANGARGIFAHTRSAEAEPSGRRSAAAGRGFTLIEVAVVVAIMGIISALVLPGLGDGLRRWRLQAAVRDFATLLKFTRNQAVAGRAPLEMILDRSRNVYWLDRPVEGGVPTAEQAMERGIRVYELPASIRFGEVSVSGGDPGLERVPILFFPRGSSTGGEVQILDEKGRTYGVSVDRMTGQARIHR